MLRHNDDNFDQLEAWNREHERLRTWYIRQCRSMKYKLKRILDGEQVYRPQDTNVTTRRDSQGDFNW